MDSLLLHPMALCTINTYKILHALMVILFCQLLLSLLIILEFCTVELVQLVVFRRQVK